MWRRQTLGPVGFPTNSRLGAQKEKYILTSPDPKGSKYVQSTFGRENLTKDPPQNSKSGLQPPDLLILRALNLAYCLKSNSFKSNWKFKDDLLMTEMYVSFQYFCKRNLTLTFNSYLVGWAT